MDVARALSVSHGTLYRHFPARFHHPALAKEWLSASNKNEFEQVWNLLESGFLKK